jgi:prephenate dehydratase
MRIGYLGPEASFSNEAALKKFKGEELIPFNSIGEVISGLANGEVSRAVVPIENSSGGNVSETLDKLVAEKVFIIEEFSLKIKHCLLSRRNINEIKTIYSHPQALVQCSYWLEENAKGIEKVITTSTSKAAEQASLEIDAGAIASKLAAKKFGLDIIEEDINNSKDNETKFVVLSKTKPEEKNQEKVALFFGVKDKPGALLDILEVFKKYNINMTKLESRPTKKQKWEYLFFTEIEAILKEEETKKALKEVGEKSTYYKFVGAY